MTLEEEKVALNARIKTILNRNYELYEAQDAIWAEEEKLREELKDVEKRLKQIAKITGTEEKPFKL